MLRKVITSFGFGVHNEYLQVALPTFYKYAQRYNYDLFLPEHDYLTSLYSGINSYPYSWWKVPLLQKLLENYDIVLWLDADTVITSFSADIIEANKFNKDKHAQGMTFHQVDVGTVPNCGVWLVSKLMNQFFPLIMGKKEYKNHGWWEQAANMDLMGYQVSPVTKLERKTKLMEMTCEFGLEWNLHCNDVRQKPPEIFIKHATMMNPRLGIMKGWVTP